MYQIEEISWLWLGIIPIFVVILFAIDRIWKSKLKIDLHQMRLY